MTEVVINGERYLPAVEVVANYKIVAKALLELYYGKSYVSRRGEDWPELEAGAHFIRITEKREPGTVSISDFIADLFGEPIA
ncbi:MAG TPA: hypothetical protein PKD55_02540 [Bellilinea sp.]|nr:hypothetical protein [Bellilinea sp.]